MSTLGFVGTGFHARTNLLPAVALANLAVAGLASRNAERSAEALTRAGLTGRGFGSVSDLISHVDGLDRVIVCAQPADQPAIIRELLQAGIHVLAEKPLGLDEDQARELAEIAKNQGVTLRAAFMKRHAPMVQVLTELIAGGELGEVLSFAISFGAEASAFAPTPADFIRLAAIHHVDLVRALFGEPARVNVDFAGDIDAYTVNVTLRMFSGAVGVLRLTNAPAHTSELDVVSVTCERGTATLTDTQELTISRGAPVADWQTVREQVVQLGPGVSTMSGGARDLLYRGFTGEVQSFASTDFAADGGAAESNVRTMALVDSIIQQVPLDHRGLRALPIAFGPAGHVRDMLNEAICSGAKTSSSNLLTAYRAAGETVPTVGERRLLLGSDGAAVALLRFDRVLQRRLGEVDADLAALEHVDVDTWQRNHRSFWDSLTPRIREHLCDRDCQPSDDDVVVTAVFTAERLPR